jgi:hypothetical protein
VAWAKNRTKSQVRAQVEHVVGVLKLKFGFVKVRYRGLKERQSIIAACALANLYRAEKLLRMAAAEADGTAGHAVSPSPTKTLRLAVDCRKAVTCSEVP